MQDRDFSRNEAEADANGRVTFGGHQGLHITNLLNLPQSITTTDGMTTEYRYLGDGTKIYAGDTSDEGCGTCYRGSFVYFPMSKNIYLVSPQGVRRVQEYRNWKAK